MHIYCNFTNCRCVKISVASDRGAFGVLSFATKMVPSQTRCAPASAGDLRFARAASRESRPIS